MRTAANIVGLITTFMIVMGGLFKIQHWPGAGPLLVFGTTLHILIFLPLWVIVRIKETPSGMGKALAIISVFVLWIFYIHLMFKVQHWPGAAPMFVGAVLFALVGWLPVFLINFKEESRRPVSITFALFMIIPIIFLVLPRNVSRDVLNSYIMTEQHLDVVNRQAKVNADLDYAMIDHAFITDPAKSAEVHTKAQTLQRASLEMYSYLGNLRSMLIQQTDKLDAMAADTVSLVYVASKDNYDIPTHILIGDDPANPKEGDFTARNLRKKLQAYTEAVKQVCGEEEREKLRTLDKLTSDVAFYAYGITESWETANFYHMPLAAVICNLKAIEAEVRSIEQYAAWMLRHEVEAGN